MADASNPDRAAIMAGLNTVQDPCSVASGRAMGLVDMGLVERVEIVGGEVDVYLRLTSPACYMMPFLEAESVREVMQCDGVTKVSVHPDEGLDWSPEFIAPHLRVARRVAVRQGGSSETLARAC